MEKIKAGAKSRGALYVALGSTIETIHATSMDYSKTIRDISIKLVEKDKDLAIKMLTEGYIELDGERTTSITQVWYGKYDRKADFSDSLNDGQKRAYLRALATEEDLFIDGMGGTGKTTLLIRIAQKLGMDCCILAPTNAAVKRIVHELPQEHGLLVTTIHRALSYKAATVVEMPEDEREALELKFSRRSEGRLPPIVILDESGMVASTFIDEIKELCNRMIFFGDLCQLEPVEGEQYNFDDVEQLELTQQMRQDFTDTSLFRSINSFRDAIKNGSRRRGEVDMRDDTVQEVESLAKHFVDSGEIDVLASFTNNTVIKTNNYIKEKITGTSEYREGNRVLLYSPINDYDGTVCVSNGSIVTIEVVGYNSNIGREEYLFVGVQAEMKIIFQTAKDCYDYWNANFKQKGKRMGWRKFNSLSVVARPLYCRTTHKLQGSTFGVVGINHDDIAKAFDTNTYNRLMYVALSRAKRKVFIMN